MRLLYIYQLKTANKRGNHTQCYVLWIRCIAGHGMSDDVVKVINTFCFFTSTYTVVNINNNTFNFI